MKNFTLALVIGLLTALGTLAATHAGPFDRLDRPGENAGSVEITENIKLYSDGKLVGEWTGIGKGRLDGDTYVFKTRRGQFSKTWRIKGDFVVERLPN